jgi:hypothetical protein
MGCSGDDGGSAAGCLSVSYREEREAGGRAASRMRKQCTLLVTCLLAF